MSPEYPQEEEDREQRDFVRSAFNSQLHHSILNRTTYFSGDRILK